MSHKNRTPVNISTTGNQVQETQIDNGEMLNLADSIKTKNQDRSKAGKTTGIQTEIHRKTTVKFSGETKITTNHLKGMLHLNAQRDGLNLLSEILLQEKNPVQYLLKEGLTGK